MALGGGNSYANPERFMVAWLDFHELRTDQTKPIKFVKEFALLPVEI